METNSTNTGANGTNVDVPYWKRPEVIERQRQRRAAARQGEKTKPDGSPLQAKVAEMERLAAEIKEMDESRTAKIRRLDELKGEISKFLASVSPTV